GRHHAGVGQGGRAGRGQGAADFRRTEPDSSGGASERKGDALLVKDAASDVAVDLERGPVEGAVALAGGGPAEGGQLVGQHSPAARVARQGRSRGEGRPG